MTFEISVGISFLLSLIVFFYVAALLANENE